MMVDFVKDYDGLSEAELYNLFYQIIREIPIGKVATYGQIALLADRPRDARYVGHALHAVADPDIPWQRVVMASGEIATRSNPGERERQRAMLRKEGVEFVAEYQIDMQRCGWQKTPPDLFG